MSVATLNTHPEFYSSRLQENLRDIPYTIFEHLLADDILRYKQKEAINSTALKMFDEHKRALALIMPTGTGKTVIMARMLAGLKLDEKIGHKTKKILIVTDSEEGVKNTVEKLKEFAGIDAGVYYGKEKDIEDKQVIVTIYNSWQDPEFPIDPEDIDLTILDEGHKGLSEARQETLKKHDNSIFLALTASPTYDEERDLLEHFDLAYKMTVPEAVEYGLICSIRNMVLNSNVNLDLEELAKFDENFDKALERETKKEAANRELIKYLVHGLHPDTKQPVRDIRGIGSCYDTEHAEFVASKLNEEYNKAFPDKPFKHGFAQFIAGDTPNRDEIIEQHRAGEIQYLIYADLLNQNYDDKKIGVVANFRMTDSLVLAIQRGGRSTRLDEEDPGKIALIIDVFHKFKGKFKKQPLFYAHAIGSATLITKEAERLAIEKSLGFSPTTLARLKEAKEEARAMQFDIVTQEESILGLFNDYVLGKEIPVKTDKDLTIKDLVEIGMPVTNTWKVLQNFEQDWAIYEEKKAQGAPEADNPEPPFKVYRVKQPKGYPGLAINNDPVTVESFKMYVLGDAYGIQKKTEQDLTHKDLVEAGIPEKIIIKGLLALDSAWVVYEEKKAQGVPEADNPEPPVKVYKVNSYGTITLAINNDSITMNAFKVYALGDVYGVRKKTGKDLTSKDIIETGISKDRTAKGLKDLDRAWVVYEEKKAQGVPEADNPEPPVKVYKVNSYGQLALAINNDPACIEAFDAYTLGDAHGLRKKTEKDLTYGEVGNIGISRHKAVKGLQDLERDWAIYEEKKAQGVPEADNPEPPVKVYKVKPYNGIPTLAINNDPVIVEAFKMYASSNTYGIQKKTEQDLASTDIAGISIRNVVKGLQDLERDWAIYEEKKAQGVPEADNPEPPVKVYEVNSRGTITLAINNDPVTVESFKIYVLGDAYGIQKKTEQDLTNKDLIETGIPRDRAAKGLRDLDRAWIVYEEKKAQGVPEADNPEPPVKVYKVKPSTGEPTWAINSDPVTVELFKMYVLGDAYGIQKKTEQDLTHTDLVESGIPEKMTTKGLRILEQNWLIYEERKTQGVLEADNPEPPVKVYKVNSSGFITLAINNDSTTIDVFKQFIAEKKNLLSSTNTKSVSKNSPPKPD